MANPPQEISTTEAAEILGCDVRTIRYMIERGSLSARLVKVDPYAKKGAYRVKRTDVLELQKMQIVQVEATE